MMQSFETIYISVKIVTESAEIKAIIEPGNQSPKYWLI